MADKIPQSKKLYVDLTGIGGLSPRWFGDEGDTISQYPQYRYTAQDGQMTAGVWNPERRYGFMAPASNSYTTVTESDGSVNFTNEWRATVYDPLSQFCWMGENGNILWRASAAGTFTDLRTSSSTVTNPITGTNVKVTDLDIYQVNGVRCLTFTYQETASGGNMGIITLTSSNENTPANTDWLHGQAANGIYLQPTADHFMVPSDNGYMYIGDGNYVHKFDGTVATGGSKGTVTSQVLVIPATYTFTDGADFKGHTFLSIVDTPLAATSTVTYSGGFAGVYVWDRQTTSANIEDFIPVKGVKDIKKIYVTRQGQLRILCLSSKGTTQIREYNGAVFEIIAESHLVTYPLYRDCFQVGGNLIYWMGLNGRVYGHGLQVEKGVEALFQLGDATAVPDTGNFNAGAMLYLAATGSQTSTKTGLMLSFRSSTPTVSNKIWYPNTVGATPYVGNVYTPVKMFAGPVKVNYVRVYHNAGSTAASSTQQGTLSIYLNQATSANITSNITRTDINKGWKYVPVNQGAKNAVFSIQASIAWANQTTADSTDWMPRLLEVDYTPLEKLL